jgi:hypothetical protein
MVASPRVKGTLRPDTGQRRVGGEAPVPALRPVVSSPPPSEPDMRLPPHPALHEHDERRSPAAGAGREVPAARVQRRAGIPSDLLPSSRAACPLDPFALWTAFPPSPVGRYCHDYYGSSATSRRQRRTVRLPLAVRLRGAPPGRFPRSLICRSAGSAPSCTPLLSAVTAPGAGPLTPPGHMAPRGASCRGRRAGVQGDSAGLRRRQGPRK